MGNVTMNADGAEQVVLSLVGDFIDDALKPCEIAEQKPQMQETMDSKSGYANEPSQGAWELPYLY